MSVSKTQISVLTGVYASVRKSGLLETRPGSSLFVFAYDLYKRYLEDPFHALAQRHPELFRGGHALDIGANIGYTSMVFARAIDPVYRVYSFEPEEFNFSLLSRRARSPEMHGRIVAFQSAIGAKDGTIELWRNEHHHADHRILTDRFRESGIPSNTVSVPITRIDTFVLDNGPLRPIRFIKVDVQGYEFPVCQGMEQTLAGNHDAVIALEYSPDAMAELGFQPEEMLVWLTSRGYAAYTLSRDGRLKSGIPSDLSKVGYVDLIFSRRPISSDP
jgi:FkbM family methyltransferase